MTVTVDQRALVLNTFAMTLQNNLVTSEAVTWNEMDGEMDDRNGLQVIRQVSPRYNITRTENGVKDLSGGAQGSVFGSELFEVTGTFGTDMEFSDFARIKDVRQARNSEALLGHATSMAERIDGYILETAASASADWLGDGSSSVNEWSNAAAAYARLKENGVNDVGMRYIMNADDELKLGDQVVKLPSTDAFATATFRRGFQSEISGHKTLFTNQLPTLTTGTRATTGEATVGGANQNVNYKDVAKAGTVNGRHKTQTLTLANAGTKTYKKGEVFTIPGVFAYDNRKQALVSPARLQQITIVEDAVAVAGVVTLRVFPAFVVPGSGTGDDIGINTAHATVSAAPANGAVLTFIGAPSTILSPRLLIQKQAVVVNTMPLIMPASDTALRRRLRHIPLTVRMWQHSDWNTGKHSVRFDVALNANIGDRSRMARFNGG